MRPTFLKKRLYFFVILTLIYVYFISTFNKTSNVKCCVNKPLIFSFQRRIFWISLSNFSLLNSYQHSWDINMWSFVCYHFRLKARDVMDEPQSYLYTILRVSSLIRMLRTTAHHAFPVVSKVERRNKTVGTLVILSFLFQRIFFVYLLVFYIK